MLNSNQTEGRKPSILYGPIVNASPCAYATYVALLTNVANRVTPLRESSLPARLVYTVTPSSYVSHYSLDRYAHYSSPDAQYRFHLNAIVAIDRKYHNRRASKKYRGHDPQ